MQGSSAPQAPPAQNTSIQLPIDYTDEDGAVGPAIAPTNNLVDNGFGPENQSDLLAEVHSSLNLPGSRLDPSPRHIQLSEVLNRNVPEPPPPSRTAEDEPIRRVSLFNSMFLFI